MLQIMLRRHVLKITFYTSDLLKAFVRIKSLCKKHINISGKFFLKL